MFDHISQQILDDRSISLQIATVMLVCAVVLFFLATLLGTRRRSALPFLIAASAWVFAYWFCRPPIPQLDFRELVVQLTLLLSLSLVFISVLELLGVIQLADRRDAELRKRKQQNKNQQSLLELEADLERHHEYLQHLQQKQALKYALLEKTMTDSDPRAIAR